MNESRHRATSPTQAPITHRSEMRRGAPPSLARPRTWILRLALLAGFGGLAACAGAIVSPSTAPMRPASEALLVLPGFGYGPGGARALRSLEARLAAEGLDLFVPAYLSRRGLGASRERVRQFIRQQQLDRYARVHVVAFIAGAWTLNPLLEAGELPNLATIVYDRSPLQERAPRIADERLHVLTWLRFGSSVFDVARAAYAPFSRAGVKVGILVETSPTGFLCRHEETARAFGPLDFGCRSLGQPYDDCVYLAMSHDELYARFGEVWPAILAFIRAGRFPETANRSAPAGDPFARQGPG